MRRALQLLTTCSTAKAIVKTANFQRAGPHSLSDSNTATHIRMLMTATGMPMQQMCDYHPHRSSGSRMSCRCSITAIYIDFFEFAPFLTTTGLMMWQRSASTQVGTRVGYVALSYLSRVGFARLYTISKHTTLEASSCTCTALPRRLSSHDVYVVRAWVIRKRCVGSRRRKLWVAEGCGASRR